jgi:hypothetical protein
MIRVIFMALAAGAIFIVGVRVGLALARRAERKRALAKKKKA